jgi:hypothetical protein
MASSPFVAVGAAWFGGKRMQFGHVAHAECFGTAEGNAA